MCLPSLNAKSQTISTEIMPYYSCIFFTAYILLKNAFMLAFSLIDN